MMLEFRVQHTQLTHQLPSTTSSMACIRPNTIQPAGALTGVEHLAIGGQLPGNDASCANARLAANVQGHQHSTAKK
jgi:hypothetical protein